MSVLRKYTTEQGNLDPVALRVVISSSDVVPDLTLVTSVSISAKDYQTGTVYTWSTTFIAQVATSLTVEHRYQSADTSALRTYHCVPWMTVTGAANPIAAESFDLEVIER